MTVKPWMTKVAAGALLVIGYMLHKSIIPPGYEWHGVSVAGVLTDLMTTLAALGISGPQLWPRVAALMGNPPAPAQPPKSTP